jgi:TRAP-type C4-dicarboxylate transport system permease small subunit
MIETEDPPEEPRAPVSASGAFGRITALIALGGGALVLAAALLVVASVLLRWLFNAPIDGDFEYVKMATAVAVFAFLPFTQARRGNIMAVTFTSRLPQRVQALMDGCWDLAYAALMGFVAYALTFGTLDALRSGETTMQRQIPLWPSIALAAALCALLALTALWTAARQARKPVPRPHTEPRPEPQQAAL